MLKILEFIFSPTNQTVEITCYDQVKGAERWSFYGDFVIQIIKHLEKDYIIIKRSDLQLLSNANQNTK
jgi:hypothetical protein